MAKSIYKGKNMKLLRINMKTCNITEESLENTYTHLGGRGLTSFMINDLVPAKCDPLGPDNILVFAPGLLCGTPMVNTGRLSIGAKSPLTGGIKESNCGGTMAMALARLGFRAVVIEDQAPEDKLFNLIIDQNGKASLEDAASYKTMGNYQLAEQLFKKHGVKNAVSSIGPCGEMMLTSASIQTTDPDGQPCRSAARGGLGAVMGSKGLKAVVVSRQGHERPIVSDPDRLKHISKLFAMNIKNDGWSGDVLPNFGTASILSSSNASGALPTRNARQGRFDASEKIDGDALAEIIKKRGGKTTHKGCSQCIINCSNVFVDSKGQPVTSALEYETIWAMGAMTCIDDLDAIARLDYLCDDIGLDTMNTGVAMAVAMDAGALSFGDKTAAIKLIASIIKGDPLGKCIGNGPDDVAKYLHHKRVPTVKGQSIAGYDPRGMPGMGVTYATSPMGADHTAGFVGGARGSIERLIQMSQSSQVHMAALDSMGLCMFAQSGGMEAVCEAVSIVLDKPFKGKDWQELGNSIIEAELKFNQRAGLTQKDDELPAMFHEESLGPLYDTVPYLKEDPHAMYEPLRKIFKETL